MKSFSGNTAKWFGAAMLVSLVGTSVYAANAGKSSKSVAPEEDVFTPVVFSGRPAADALLPQNADEAAASVVVLSYSVEHKADISNWALKGTTTERHRGRYLVRDTNGVANLKKHTFFGDETDVVVANVQGQTISPDGSIHPIDPDKDIRKLDIERAQEQDDILRTVSFPRVEPGAILDLAWTAQRKQLPSMEVVDLEGAYPIRDLSVKVRGRLIGQGKAFMLGSGQYYWVPFFASRIPKDTKVRMSTAFDLELSANNLPSYQDEPLAPPPIRTSAWLAIVPQSFHIGQWKDHFHLFDDPSSLPDVTAGKREWHETTIGVENALATVDEFGLQTLPLRHNKAQKADFQASFRYMDNDYKAFLRRKKNAESPARLAEIAPPELSVDQRVDLLLDYVDETIELVSDARPNMTLTELKNRGRGSGLAVMYYARYLMEQAGLPVTLVWIADRTESLIIPALNDKSLYGGTFFLEIDSGPQKRYVRPYRRYYDRYALPPEHLGAIMFREAGKNEPWDVDRIDLATNSKNGLLLEIKSAVVIDEETELTTRFEPIGDQAEFFLQAYESRSKHFQVDAHQEAQEAQDRDEAKPSKKKLSQKQKIAKKQRLKRAQKKAKKEQAALEAKVEREEVVLRGFLGSWLDTEIDEDTELTTPPALRDKTGFRPIGTWEQVSAWEPKVEDLGDSVLVAPVPMVNVFRNKLVDDDRTQPIWLRGGSWIVQMDWLVGDEFMAPDASQTQSVRLSGPGGLNFELTQSWDAGARVFRSRAELLEPFMLPASDYRAVQKFYVDLQRAVEQPVLLKRL